MTKHYDFIDTLKGYTVIWVVLMHMHINPGLIDASTQMPIFFFASGLFFKIKPVKEFFISKINSLIVPFFFFWLISWIYKVILGEFIPVRFSFSEVDWFAVFNIFTKYSYMQVNILWFLAALFTTHTIYYFVIKYLKFWYIILLCFAMYVFGCYLAAIKYHNLIFPVYEFLIFQLWFVVGYYLKEVYFNILNIKNKLHIISVIVGCVLVMVTIPKIFDRYIPYMIYMVPYTLCTILLLSMIMKLTDKYKIWNIFKYYGKNSIVIYLTHMLIIYNPCIYNFMHCGQNELLRIWFVFIGICAFELLLIKLFVKYIPQFIGKKPLLKYE